MKYLLSALFCCGLLVSFSQSKVEFKSADSLAFFIKIENEKINLLPSSDISFLWNKGGKQSFTFQFANTTLGSFDQMLEVKPNFHQTFELKKVKGVFQFFQIVEAAFIFPNITPADSLSTDSLFAPVPSYQGLTKCETPIVDYDFTIIKENLQRFNFEFKRMAYLQKTLPEHCFRVEQIRYLISQLELEDNKLSIVELSVPHIYDFDRASLLAEDFFLERNKTKVKALFQ